MPSDIHSMVPCGMYGATVALVVERDSCQCYFPCYSHYTRSIVTPVVRVKSNCFYGKLSTKTSVVLCVCFGSRQKLFCKLHMERLHIFFRSYTIAITVFLFTILTLVFPNSFFYMSPAVTFL